MMEKKYLVLIWAVLLSACASLPDIEDATAIDLRTGWSAPYVPEVDIDGNPATRPGSMAKDALEASSGCDWAALFCAAIFVPVATVTGAVITAADTLPEEQAILLNRLTRRQAAGINLRREFDDAMQAEAAHHGLQLRRRDPDAKIMIAVIDLWWEVSVGNQVYLHMKVEASGRRGVETGRRRLSYKGEVATVEEWLADGGQRIRGTLETFMAEASTDIWPRLLNRE